MNSLLKQIRDAQREVAKWPQWMRDSMVLQGTDPWHERTQRYLAEKAAAAKDANK